MKTNVGRLAVLALILLVLPSTAFAAEVTIGPRKLLKAGTRSPLGNSFSGGRIVVAQKKTSDGGSTWSDHSLPFSDSGLHRSVTLTDKVVLYGGQLTWDSSVLKWRGTYQQATDIDATSRVEGYYVMTLPGDSNWTWYVHQAFMHDGRIYLTVKRRVTRSTSWRGSSVTGTFYETHLVKSDTGAYTSFGYVGVVANESHFDAAKTADNKSVFSAVRLPLYEADNPRCISVSSSRIVCAMRTSADDDDINRPLSAADIFPASGSTITDKYDRIKGSEIVSSVYSPALNADTYYKGGLADIQPLLVAVGNYSGSTWTWTRKFIADRGGIDSHFAADDDEDPGVLVIAYGGLTYPRKGVAIQYSTDSGDNWSDPINVSEEEGFTEGLTFLTHVSDGKFLLVYATSSKYNVSVLSQWDIYYREITIIP